MFEFTGAQGGIVTLSFDQKDWLEPNTVLIIPFYHGDVIFVKHMKRGWELPGGTREEGEFPIQTAVRELFEEAGAEACALELIGQYILEHPSRSARMIKSIYVARVSTLFPLPDGFETVEIKCLRTFPDWEDVQVSNQYSFILKDGVYRYITEHVKGHRFSSQMDSSV